MGELSRADCTAAYTHISMRPAGTWHYGAASTPLPPCLRSTAAHPTPPQPSHHEGSADHGTPHAVDALRGDADQHQHQDGEGQPIFDRAQATQLRYLRPEHELQAGGRAGSGGWECRHLRYGRTSCRPRGTHPGPHGCPAKPPACLRPAMQRTSPSKLPSSHLRQLGGLKPKVERLSLHPGIGHVAALKGPAVWKRGRAWWQQRVVRRGGTRQGILQRTQHNSVRHSCAASPRLQRH